MQAVTFLTATSTQAVVARNAMRLAWDILLVLTAVITTSAATHQQLLLPQLAVRR
jgi:hypothetical protein